MKPTDEQLQLASDVAYNDAKLLGLTENIGEAVAFKAGWDSVTDWAISQMQPEWVACSERLPKCDSDVYFYRLGISQDVYEGEYVGTGFFQQGSDCYYVTVTHFIEKFKPQPPTK